MVLKKRWWLLAFAGILLTVAFIVQFNSVYALTNISGCGALSTSNEVYQMNQSIVPNGAAGTTCVSLSGVQNVTLRGYGYSIWNQTYAGIGVGVAGASKNVTIEGFNVSVFNAIPAELGSSYCYRVSSNNVTIKNSFCENSRAGVWLNTFPNSTKIINNTFKFLTSFSSVYVQTGVDDLIIANNTIYNETFNAPFSFVTANMRASNILIDNNLIVGSNRTVNMATTTLRGGNITISNNRIVNMSSRHFGQYFIDIRGGFNNVIISGNNFSVIKTNGSLYTGDIHLDNATNFQISNNNLIGDEAIYGIELSVLNENGSIFNNLVQCNSSLASYGLHGIILRQGRNISVYNNNISSCAFGILAHNGSREYVFRDNVLEDAGVGLYIIDDSMNGSFYNNSFTNGGTSSVGIHLFTYSDRNNPSPSYNLIENNTINNYTVGIKISNGTNNNVLKTNTVINSGQYNVQTVGLSYTINNVFINNTLNNGAGSLFTLVKGLYIESSQYGIKVNYTYVSGTLTSNMSLNALKIASSSANTNNITLFALSNELVHNSTAIAGSANISSNDGAVNVSNFGGTANTFQVLNEYNLTEGEARESDPVNQTSMSTSGGTYNSTLTDEINATVYKNVSSCDISSIVYTPQGLSQRTLSGTNCNSTALILTINELQIRNGANVLVINYPSESSEVVSQSSSGTTDNNLCEDTFDYAERYYSGERENVDLLVSEMRENNTINRPKEMLKLYLLNWQTYCSDIVMRTLNEESVCSYIANISLKNETVNTTFLESLKQKIQSEEGIKVSTKLIKNYIDNYKEKCPANEKYNPIEEDEKSDISEKDESSDSGKNLGFLQSLLENKVTWVFGAVLAVVIGLIIWRAALHKK